MSKTLVTYFTASAGHVTERVAKRLADVVGADLFEIEALEPYTEADIKWTNPLARCNKEKIGRKDVPFKNKIDNLDEYDTVYIGFPIWYAIAPNIVHTFAKAHDWTSKKIVVFATSGGSGIGKSAAKLAPHVKGGEIIADKLLTLDMSDEEYRFV